MSCMYVLTSWQSGNSNLLAFIARDRYVLEAKPLYISKFPSFRNGTYSGKRKFIAPILDRRLLGLDSLSYEGFAILFLFIS